MGFASQMQGLHVPVLIITDDTGMSVRAVNRGLEVRRLRYGNGCLRTNDPASTPRSAPSLNHSIAYLSNHSIQSSYAP